MVATAIFCGRILLAWGRKASRTGCGMPVACLFDGLIVLSLQGNARLALHPLGKEAAVVVQEVDYQPVITEEKPYESALIE